MPEGATFCPSCGNAAVQVNNPAPSANDAAIPAAYSVAQQSSYQQQPYQQAGAQQSGYPQPPQSTQQPYGQQQSYGQQQPYGQQPSSQPQYGQPAGVNPDYHKLGGWLLFFVVLTIIGLIGALKTIIDAVGLYSDGNMEYITMILGDGYSTALMVSIIGTIVVFALQVTCLVMIFQRNHNFLRIYQIAFIISIVFAIITMIMLSMVLSGNSLVGDAVGSSIPSIVIGVVELILFTMYYCKSVRVRTYMGGTEYQQKALFRIGV